MKCLYGRSLLLSEINQATQQHLDHPKVIKMPGVIEKRGKWYCQRCQSIVKPIEPTYCLCGRQCGYCTECIEMGKVKRCSMLYGIQEPNEFKVIDHSVLAWEGTLSSEQSRASQAIMTTIAQKQTRLLWAVAGAGKTEMLFPGIDQALQRGLRVAIASPRVDVCLELAPRIKEAFPSIPVAVLHGQQTDTYQYCQLTIATTHQLLRFKEAFDVLIIDEIDAFPFRDHRFLHVAASAARKKSSALIYLTATPERKMQQQVKKGQLAATILPARYHGYPLPVPRGERCAQWSKRLLKKHSTAVLEKIKALVAQKRQFLVFVPNIKWVLKWEKVLRYQVPTARFEVVYASDDRRHEKVMAMRHQRLDFLVTTTILERGVTFKDIDVLVVGSDDRIFTEASLVQIAGRVGRSAQYPGGEVIYYYHQWTVAMKRAIKHIKQMNHLAQKRGLL